MAITTERVDVPTDTKGESFHGYLARPEGDEALPAVIVYMEIFGVNAHIRDVTDRVAREVCVYEAAYLSPSVAALTSIPAA